MRMPHISRWLMTVACITCMTIVMAQDKVVFTPQWTAQAQFTGYYIALVKGFYKESGLDVTIKHPAASRPPYTYIAEKESQMISLNLSTAMVLIDKGVKLVNVMQSSQQNGTVIVSRTPISGVESLIGMKIGCWKMGFNEMPMALDNKYRLNIKWVPFISNVNLYISGAIDATLAMTYNELFQLKLAGQRIKSNQLLYLADFEGFNIPEDGLYVTDEYYQKHKQTVEKFVAASRKGWEWAVKHPEEALDIVMMVMKENGMPYNQPAQRWMLNECLKLLINKQTGKRTYKLDPEALKTANKILREGGFISKDVTYKQLVRL